MGRKYPKPSVPFIESYHQGSKQKPALIMLDSTFATSGNGAAFGLANARHDRRSAHKSAHYIVDANEIFGCVPLEKKAIREREITNVIIIDLCDDPSKLLFRWGDAQHQAIVDKTCDLIAQLCLLYKISPRVLSEVELAKWCRRRKPGRGGIVTGDQLNTVCGQGSRYGLGDWPINNFISLVERQIEARRSRR